MGVVLSFLFIYLDRVNDSDQGGLRLWHKTRLGEGGPLASPVVVPPSRKDRDRDQHGVAASYSTLPVCRTTGPRPRAIRLFPFRVELKCNGLPACPDLAVSDVVAVLGWCL